MNWMIKGLLLLSMFLGQYTVPKFNSGTFSPRPFGFVQGCNTSIGATGTPFFLLVIGVGGSTGCTTVYNPSDALIVDYRVFKSGTLSDPTTGSLSLSTGATISWTKAGSYSSGANTFSGTFYVCPSGVTSPTSTITIKFAPSASVTFSGITVTEVDPGATCAEDQYFTSTGTGSGTITSSSSAALAQAQEYVDVGVSGPSTNAWTAGSCFGGTCTQLSDFATNVTGGTEYFTTAATTAGTVSAGIGATSGTWVLTTLLLE